jgi:hypothetical protein
LTCDEEREKRLSGVLVCVVFDVTSPPPPPKKEKLAVQWPHIKILLEFKGVSFLCKGI